MIDLGVWTGPDYEAEKPIGAKKNHYYKKVVFHGD
jgi:hypothetical protein